MFTGIIRAMGNLAEPLPQGGPGTLAVDQSDLAPTLRAGESVAVNGVCLTVVGVEGPRIRLDVTPQTMRLTTLGKLYPDDPVNLEPALTLMDALGGHLVSGHVDGIGTVTLVTPEENAIRLDIEAPDAVVKYLVPRGSVAVEGVSLTVAAVQGRQCTVYLIPHTAMHTTLGNAVAGSMVNLEGDLVAKYLEGLAAPYLETKTGKSR